MTESGSAFPVGRAGVATGVEAYLDALPHGVVLIDASGRVVLCTQAARELLGVGGAPPPRARQLLRGLVGSERRQTLAQLRLALEGATTAGSFDIVRADRRIEVTMQPVAGGGWAATLADVTTRRAAESGAAELARLDPLTGLANRRHFGERVGEALAAIENGAETHAVLLLDLDRFKQVNDTLGHPVGDALLRNVAGRLRSLLGPADTLARLGGDEFAVLLEGTADRAESLARRIVDLVGRSYMVEGHLVSIGASVGLAVAPADGSETSRVLKSADLALYRAKMDGRGTFRRFEPEMDARVRARRAMELDLRRALALGEFELHYQPQLNLETDSLTGCEALLRWRHPERGLVSPVDFIPLAEEIGLIVPIGEWALRSAAKEAMRWPGSVSVAVNVSPVQFKSRRLVQAVAGALQASGLPARRLELEITEGVLLQETEATLDTLHRLRALGVRISMDDFGTGYSSLSYLRSFPFDKIKIDRTFVRDLSVRPEGDALIRAIAGLGRSLGMTTVAEGVETSEQMRRVRAEGCTDVQGYLVSKPVPAAAVLALLTRSASRAA